MLRRSLCLAVLALLATAAPAAAVPPTTEITPIDETVFLPAGSPDNPCPFAVTFDNHGLFVFKTFYDASGTPVRGIALSAHFTETFSANGKSISSTSPATAHIDPATNTAVATGTQRHFTVPGEGVVYARSGRVVIDLSTGEVLSMRGLDIPPGSALCAALAP